MARTLALVPRRPAFVLVVEEDDDKPLNPVLLKLGWIGFLIELEIPLSDWTFVHVPVESTSPVWML